MDKQRFWRLVEAARAEAPDPDDGEDVARRAAERLATHPAEEIVAAEQALWDLLADAHTSPLWAAAYVINGGCSDDAFDYFRGWLILQGRATFERAVADPDGLAELPAVRTAVADGLDLDGEEALNIAATAHLMATGRRLPDDACVIRYPEPDPARDFDFDDDRETARRLPGLTALRRE
ncbi:DUF4240 domain-containing protein [Streptomyces sp. URMC 126]|uniref:DUF4240 domain-containing protein n=1 Tax=Streptomyces sp. URMC 126 TaxID=3423401 RepID=UPI003F1ADD18